MYSVRMIDSLARNSPGSFLELRPCLATKAVIPELRALILFELVAIGPQGGDSWTRPLEPGKVVRLGRAPKGGWSVPWDMRISREHCDIELKNDRLYVQGLDKARNPIYRLGEISRQFTVFPGETFRIGLTTFRLNAPSADAKDRKRDFDVDLGAEVPEVALVETDRVDGEFEHLRDELASLRAQVQADALAKRNASEQGQIAREEVRMLRNQLNALKVDLLAAQREVERLQSESDGDVSGSKEFQELRAEVDRLKVKVESGEFLAVSTDSDRDSDSRRIDDSTAEKLRKAGNSDEEKAKPDSADNLNAPKGLDALRAKLAAKAKDRDKHRRSE